MYFWLEICMVKNHSKMGCRMPLKVHILYMYLDKFKQMEAYWRSTASTSTRIYSTLNTDTEEHITRI